MCRPQRAATRRRDQQQGNTLTRWRCTAATDGICVRTAAHLPERTLSSVAVGFGSHGDVPSKERGKVAWVHASDLRADLDQGQVGVDQHPLGPLDAAPAHVLVGRQPGGVLEQMCKMGRAHLRHGGERGQGQRLLQMGVDIGVLEFYASAPLAPGPALRDALTQMGIQLGRAVERERTAAQVQRHQEALVQREKLATMGSLLASVAHELNNPLAVIMIQAELLRSDAGGGPLAAYAEDITQAAARCERLVDQFLTLARPHVPERTMVDLNALIMHTMELLALPLQVDTIAVDLRLGYGQE